MYTSPLLYLNLFFGVVALKVESTKYSRNFQLVTFEIGAIFYCFVVLREIFSFSFIIHLQGHTEKKQTNIVPLPYHIQFFFFFYFQM